MDSVENKRTRAMPLLDCTSIPSKFGTKGELEVLGFKVYSDASKAHTEDLQKYQKECVAAQKPYASYLHTDKFVLKNDLTIFQHAENKHDFAYMLPDPNRPSSFWMMPVAALADCKQFKALTPDERDALSIGDTCEGIPIGTHLYEALTTDEPQTYTLISAASRTHKRTHPADPDDDRKKSKTDDEEDSVKKHERELYEENMETLTSLKVPDGVPPAQPAKVKGPTLVERVLEHLRKPPAVSLTKGQFIAYAAVNSLTKPDARKMAAAGDTELKTTAEWSPVVSKEKLTMFQNVQMISNAADVIMAAVGIVHAEDQRSLHGLSEELTLEHQEKIKAVAEHTKDVAKITSLQKELDTKKAELAKLADEMKSLGEGQDAQKLLETFL